ncbi:MAG: Nramp family divalent metal transporter [Peptococcaceae bacterium]|nr:Nramp family divalent metal transporter [Peptococcaceae bacterium]
MVANVINSVKKKSLWRNLLVFLAILGPGIVTGSVDNDVGGITTYSVAGAMFGYKLIWTLIPAFIVLFVTQEMNARMGIVTGKGLADLIRENAGVKVTFFIFVFLLGADILNTMTEFSGVAGSIQIFGISKYISVPIAAIFVWFMVVKGTYRIAERIFLFFSVCLFVYVAAALMGQPDWTAVEKSIIRPDIETNFIYISTVIGIVGTTIAPWMQFYMQSAVIEKGLQLKDLKYSTLDVFIGSLCTVVVAFFIMIACAATLNMKGISINDASDAAAALAPVAGALASQVFAFGLFVASIFASVILPVATAFYVCEAFGFEAGIDKKWSEAPQFYWLYTGILAIAAGAILIPNAPLIQISLWSQRINGILLPVVLICMVIIVNKKEVMGEYVNKPLSNIISWITIVVLLALSVTLVISFFQ